MPTTVSHRPRRDMADLAVEDCCISARPLAVGRRRVEEARWTGAKEEASNAPRWWALKASLFWGPPSPPPGQPPHDSPPPLLLLVLAATLDTALGPLGELAEGASVHPDRASYDWAATREKLAAARCLLGEIFPEGQAGSA